ncbi:MAG: bacillithiol biosynthesis deacetylase BshB1, partial [Bacteroidetes bacterium]|nr:bacillithiol biosynthesis deacetylase BshB1 [Bacteroidota bacterium]
KKIEAIMAFSSQFFNLNSTEPVTPISSPEFIETVKGKNRTFGREILVEFAEGFTVERNIGVEDLLSLK